MPEGVTAEDLMTKSDWVAKEAIARGWRFTPRLHALLWGVKVGV
jgi:organic radical activating enzyme